MLKSLLMFLTATITTLSCNANSSSNKTIILTEKNTLILRNIIDDQSVVGVQNQAIRLSSSISEKNTIYLFLDTPGGDIQAGYSLINTLNGLPQRVDTITNFAGSMGFITAQSLGRRYVLPTGTFMSHRARGGLSGQIPGELNSRLLFFTGVLDAQDGVIASRLGLSKRTYQNLVINEYWTSGTNSVSNRVADEVVNVRCNKTLSEGKTEEVMYTFFGTVTLVYSSCPLISAPLEVKFDLQEDNIGPDNRSTHHTLRRTILSLVYDKRNFYENYILTNEYKKVLP